MTTDPTEPLDVDALMEGIRARVAEKKARGQYSVDALALDRLDRAAPWDQERLEEVQATAAVTQRIVVAPSDKPGLGPVVTKAKRFIVRAGWHNLEDVLGQVTRFNADMAAYASSLGAEVTRLRGEVEELRAGSGRAGDVASRLARLGNAALDARLARLESDTPAVTSGPHLPAEDDSAGPRAPEVEDLKLAAALGHAPSADLAGLLGPRARVLVLRCGDGALLEGMRADEVSGVEERAGLAAAAMRAGHRVVNADPVAHLESLAAESLDGVVASELLEELTPTRLARLMRALGRAVAPAGAVVIEVRNPRNPREMTERFWRDPRRVRPVDPETVGVLLRVAGFPEVELIWAPPEDVPASPVLGAASPSCTVVARR